MAKIIMGDLFALFNRALKKLGKNKVCLVFTANKTVKKNGSAVMGRGFAREVRDSHMVYDHNGKVVSIHRNKESAKAALPEKGKITQSNVAQYWGDVLKNGCKTVGQASKNPMIMGFIVKRHYTEKAELFLIEHSFKMLKRYALQNPEVTFLMNYPGIGNGGRRVNEVQAIIDSSKLPDNIIIAFLPPVTKGENTKESPKCKLEK